MTGQDDQFGGMEGAETFGEGHFSSQPSRPMFDVLGRALDSLHDTGEWLGAVGSKTVQVCRDLGKLMLQSLTNRNGGQE